MNLNLLKLRKSLLQLAEVETDKGVLVIESELAEGVEVFVEDENGEWIPAEDGEYMTEDKVIVIVDGKVAELKDKEPENDPETKDNEQMQEPDEKDAKIAELEAKVAELETSSAEKDATIEEKNATIEEKDAKIAELEATVAEQQEKLEMSAEKPAKDKVKYTVKSGALKYFN